MTITELLQMFSRPRNIIAAFVVQTGIQAWLLFDLLPRFRAETGGATVLDMRFGFTEEDIYSLFDTAGWAGRRVYMQFNEIDMIYPIAYSLAFALLFAHLLWRIVPPESRWSRLALMPFATALFDYAENLGVFMLIRLYPRRSQGIAQWTIVASAGKQILMWMMLGTLFVLVVAAIARQWRAEPSS